MSPLLSSPERMLSRMLSSTCSRGRRTFWPMMRERESDGSVTVRPMACVRRRERSIHCRMLTPGVTRPESSRHARRLVLEDYGQPLADADADGRDAPSEAFNTKPMGERSHDPRAGGAE